jgi:hypothetical protein
MRFVMSAPLDASTQLSVADPALFLELVEHLMRLTNDETLLLAALAAPDLAALRAELGSVLPSLAATVPGGSPLAVVLGYGSLLPTWRLLVDSVPMSLWSELELMRTLGQTSPAEHPLAELLAARA